MLSECGVSALSLPETRTAAPVVPEATDAAPPSPYEADVTAHRDKWARVARERGLAFHDHKRMYEEEKAIRERHGVTADAW